MQWRTLEGGDGCRYRSGYQVRQAPFLFNSRTLFGLISPTPARSHLTCLPHPQLLYLHPIHPAQAIPNPQTKPRPILFEFLGSKSSPQLFFRSQVSITSITAFKLPHMLLPPPLLAICASQAISSACAGQLLLGFKIPHKSPTPTLSLDSRLHHCTHLTPCAPHIPCTCPYTDLRCIYLNWQLQ